MLPAFLPHNRRAPGQVSVLRHTAGRLFVGVLLLGLVAWQVAAQPTPWQAFAGLNQPTAWLLAGAALVLLPVNLGLEVIKWRLLGRAWGLTQWWAATRAILTGQLLGLVTPARIGEYAGRLWSVRPRLRLVGLVALAICRFGQLGAALLLAGAFLAVVDSPLQPVWQGLAAAGLCAGGAGIIVSTLSPSLAFRLLRRPRVLQRLQAVLPGHSPWSERRLALVAVASGLRHVVITAQLVLFALAFWPQGLPSALPELLLAAALCFVLKSLVPSIALAELGVREAVAVAVAVWLGLPTVALFQGTLALFASNLLLPALIALPVAWRQLGRRKRGILATKPELVPEKLPESIPATKPELVPEKIGAA